MRLCSQVPDAVCNCLLMYISFLIVSLYHSVLFLSYEASTWPSSALDFFSGHSEFESHWRKHAAYDIQAFYWTTPFSSLNRTEILLKKDAKCTAIHPSIHQSIYPSISPFIASIAYYVLRSNFFHIIYCIILYHWLSFLYMYNYAVSVFLCISDKIILFQSIGRTGLWALWVYLIRPNYRTYPYKRTVKQFRSFQITARVLFVYFCIKTYVVCTHLNCIDLSMQFKWVPTIYAFINKIKKYYKHHQRKSFADPFKSVSLVGRYILYHKFSL